MRIARPVPVLVAALLAGCDPESPVDPDPPVQSEPACTDAGDRFCDGDVRVRCYWDEPDPIERVFGIEPHLAEDHEDCSEQGFVCSESSGADCVAPACAGEISFDCADRYALRQVRFAREEARSVHACSSVQLPAEEIVIALVGPPAGQPPHHFDLELRGPGAESAQFLHYGDELPCETSAGCTADLGEPRATSATVEAGAVRYVAIDSVEPFSRDTLFDLGVTCGQCGNGSVDDDETCDDGNLTAGDGCGAACNTEESWSCSASWTGPSECLYTATGCDTAIATDLPVVAFNTGALFTSQTAFGSCEPNQRARVIFEVGVPPGHTLHLESAGETRITTSCEDRSTCVGETEWINLSAGTVSVWVHASGGDDARGAVQIALEPPAQPPP